MVLTLQVTDPHPPAQYGKAATPDPAPEPEKRGPAAGADGGLMTYVDAHGVMREFEEVPPKLFELDDETMDKICEVQTAAPLSSKSDLITKHVKFLRRCVSPLHERALADLGAAHLPHCIAAVIPRLRQ